jgi:hypothetical protein
MQLTEMHDKKGEKVMKVWFADTVYDIEWFSDLH